MQAGRSKRFVMNDSTVLTHGPTASRGDRRTSNYATDTPTSARDNLTTIDLINKAIVAIKLRKLGEKLIY
jgi:hypothetical protein